MTEIDRKKQVVERYFDEVLNQRNPSASNELIWSETLKQRIGAFLLAFPDLEVRVHHIISEGDFVACHVSGEATHLAPFQGMPATGRRWAATCSALYQVRDDRISDFWVNWDLLAIMEQIGAVGRTARASA